MPIDQSLLDALNDDPDTKAAIEAVVGLVDNIAPTDVSGLTARVSNTEAMIGVLQQKNDLAEQMSARIGALGVAVSNASDPAAFLAAFDNFIASQQGDAP